ncbi:hypothetical protein LINPERPRIM_LOCUS42139 [Linum perenne]
MSSFEFLVSFFLD